MPTVGLTVVNGRAPGSGINGKNVSRNDSNGSAGRSYPPDDVKRYRHRRINEIDDVKRSSSANGRTDIPNADAVRFRVRKGRNGTNRNGGIYDSDPIIPSHNNNGPMKAFPLNNNFNHLTHNYECNGTDTNSTDSNPASNSDIPSSDVPSSPSTSNNSTTNEIKVANPRMPLQRINGHTNMRQVHPLQTNHRTVNVSNAPVARPNSTPTPDKTSYSSSSNTTPSSAAVRSVPPKTHSAVKNNQQTSPKESVTFMECQLPPGIRELEQECFVPGTKAYFQRKANLPLLLDTDAAILKRKSSISSAKKYHVTLPLNGQRQNQNGVIATQDDNTRSYVKSRSNASEIFVQPDMKIIQSCWTMILAFMGDGTTQSNKHHGPRLLGSIVASRRKYFKSSKRDWRKSGSEFDLRTSPPSSQGKVDARKRPNSMFFSRSSHSSSSASDNSSKRKFQTDANMYSALTVLQKVKFLASVGIKLAYLRDEIYCLIMKQLVSNPSSSSAVLGWILLSIIIGSFPPSEKIFGFVQKFLNHQNHAWSKYCCERLKRAVEKGPRNNPPCCIEIKAARSVEPILLPIICADQSIRTATVDPFTTSKEIAQSMSEKNRIKDPFGFCVILSAGSKTINLGAGPFPIMDAISQVEETSGPRYSKLTWKLYFRRDIFSPRDLYSSSVDHMSSWLMFSQICGGVRTGEYVCCKAADLALLVGHQYCVRNGIETITLRRVMTLCESSLPPEIYKLDKKNWCHMVSRTLRALAKETKNSVNPIDIMGQVIRYAMTNFTSHFTRYYNITTFASVGGVCTYTSDLTLRLSHEGVTVRQGDAMKILNSSSIDEAEVVTVPVVLLDAPVKDIWKVKLDTKNAHFGTTLTISIRGGGSYDITSAHGPEIYSILFRYIREISSGANKESFA